jgi:subtilase family serine protease
MNKPAQAGASAGMTIFAAARDNDSSDGGPTPANVDLPSLSPFVIGGGGTTKPADSETVWNNDPGKPHGNGTGRGFSTIFPMQPWQAGAPNGPGRMVPDVAADADLYTGYELYVHCASTPLGGTSAVAPLYAGLFASFGKKLSLATPQQLVTPQLWLNQTCFTDITVGDNGYYRALPGPDPCTLGVPIGVRLAQLFNAAPAQAQAAPAAQTSPAGEPIRLGAGDGALTLEPCWSKVLLTDTGWRARAPFGRGELVEAHVDADRAKRPACWRNKVRLGREGYFALQ